MCPSLSWELVGFPAEEDEGGGGVGKRERIKEEGGKESESCNCGGGGGGVRAVKAAKNKITKFHYFLVCLSIPGYW